MVADPRRAAVDPVPGDRDRRAAGRDAGRARSRTRRSQDRRSAETARSLGIDAVELAKGRRQQRSILSLVAPDVPGYDLASHYAAAREIGGDFFELFRLPGRGHPLGIVIADVTGKGLDAALLMAFARPVMHAAIERRARTRGCPRRGRTASSSTSVAARSSSRPCARLLHPRTGRVRIANAGHEPPLLVPADGGGDPDRGRSGRAPRAHSRRSRRRPMRRRPWSPVTCSSSTRTA